MSVLLVTPVSRRAVQHVGMQEQRLANSFIVRVFRAPNGVRILVQELRSGEVRTFDSWVAALPYLQSLSNEGLR